MDRPNWAPLEVDIARPSAARVYDYYLGGSHNFDIDRQLAEQVIEVYPELLETIQYARGFLQRAVRYVSAQGITQFLDIGSGIPTVGNVHEVALALNPDARVVYVDVDPVAVAHSMAILDDEPRATIIREDLRQPEQLLGNTELNRLLDLSKPVGLLIANVVHFIGDAEEPRKHIATLRDALAPGSYLGLCSGSVDDDETRMRQIMAIYAKSPNPMFFRTGAELVPFFEGFDLVDPGLVRLPLWHPPTPEDIGPKGPKYPGYAGVGRKR